MQGLVMGIPVVVNGATGKMGGKSSNHYECAYLDLFGAVAHNPKWEGQDIGEWIGIER
jgi:dihydrodipicolinate reductase